MTTFISNEIIGQKFLLYLSQKYVHYFSFIYLAKPVGFILFKYHISQKELSSIASYYIGPYEQNPGLRETLNQQQGTPQFLALPQIVNH